MKTSLDHLPEGKRAQLSALVERFREAAPLGLLVLFGSHARGDWADDPVTGYRSDFQRGATRGRSRPAAVGPEAPAPRNFGAEGLRL